MDTLQSEKTLTGATRVPLGTREHRTVYMLQFKVGSDETSSGVDSPFALLPRGMGTGHLFSFMEGRVSRFQYGRIVVSLHC